MHLNIQQAAIVASNNEILSLFKITNKKEKICSSQQKKEAKSSVHYRSFRFVSREIRETIIEKKLINLKILPRYSKNIKNEYIQSFF